MEKLEVIKIGPAGPGKGVGFEGESLLGKLVYDSLVRSQGTVRGGLGRSGGLGG